MSTVRLVLGLVMILLGSYVALHPLWANGRPLTSSIWFDMAFAALFLLRGVMNLRGGRKRQRAETNIDGTEERRFPVLEFLEDPDSLP